MKGFVAEVVGCYSNEHGYVVNFCQECTFYGDDTECNRLRWKRDLKYIYTIEDSEGE